MKLVSEIYHLVRKYPKEEIYATISQMKSAAISVPCNIAEGIGRQYKKDTIQFLHIARGSLYEIETLIHISIMESFIDQKSSNEVLILVEKNLQILNGLINYLKKSKLKQISNDQRTTVNGQLKSCSQPQT